MSDEAQQMTRTAPGKTARAIPRVTRGQIVGVSVHPPRRRRTPDTDAEFVADLVAYSATHLDRVQAPTLVSQAMARWRPQPTTKEETAELALQISNLVESVLEESKRVLRNRMAVDLATVLVPRLNDNKNRKHT